MRRYSINDKVNLNGHTGFVIRTEDNGTVVVVKTDEGFRFTLYLGEDGWYAANGNKVDITPH